MIGVVLLSGGVFSLPSRHFSGAEINLLANCLNKLSVCKTLHIGLLDVQYSAQNEGTLNYIEAYQQLIASMNEPEFRTVFTEDCRCSYLGYNRQGRTGLIQRLKEAWRTLLGKPSRVFYTDESGEPQDGFWKDAVRVTLDPDKVRALTPQAFNCRLTGPVYTLPVIKFLRPKHVQILSEEEYKLIKPFVMVGA